MICWFLFIFALIFDIKKGVSQNTYIGGSIAFIMFCTISLIIYSYALKYTLRRYTLDEESISFRKNKQRKVLFWKDVIRIYESNKIPSYLTDTTEGFIKQENHILSSLFKDRKNNRYWLDAIYQNPPDYYTANSYFRIFIDSIFNYIYLWTHGVILIHGMSILEILLMDH